MLQCISQRDENAIGIQRLLEDIIGAELRRLDRGLDRRMTADHYDNRRRVFLLDPLQRLDAIDARHLHIEEHEIRPPLLVFTDAVDCIGHRVHLVALELEELTERRPDTLFVVDDENSSAHQSRSPVVLYTVTLPLATRMSPTNFGITIGSPSADTPSGLEPRSTLVNSFGIIVAGTASSRNLISFTSYSA